jgi:peptidyl-prolyl cis-trans isomerase SurA
MKRFLPLLAALLIALGATSGQRAAAQGYVQGNLFAPQITVNGQGITGFEINQRMRLMQLLRAPGDLRENAEKGLIEDRLRLDVARQIGIEVSAEEIQAGMAEFAGRANLSPEEFLAAIAKGGVEAESFRDFVRAGLAWRAVVREKYRGRISISEADIDRALLVESSRGEGTKVLLSEIIIAAPPGEENKAMATAREASALRSPAEFAEMAARVSSAPSKGKGGRLDWMPLDRLPPELRPMILRLKPDTATQPIRTPNAVAVFMLRGIQDGDARGGTPMALDYMLYALGPSGAPATATAASKAIGQLDRCNDLYGLAKGQPADRLAVESGTPGSIPQDIALALASMDIGETRVLARGGNDMLLMLCERQPALTGTEAAPDRAGAKDRLVNERLQAYADSFFADQLDAAVITRP